jgi:hypothetical protein
MHRLCDACLLRKEKLEAKLAKEQAYFADVVKHAEPVSSSIARRHLYFRDLHKRHERGRNQKLVRQRIQKRAEHRHLIQFSRQAAVVEIGQTGQNKYDQRAHARVHVVINGEYHEEGNEKDEKCSEDAF